MELTACDRSLLVSGVRANIDVDDLGDLLKPDWSQRYIRRLMHRPLRRTHHSWGSSSWPHFHNPSLSPPPNTTGTRVPHRPVQCRWSTQRCQTMTRHPSRPLGVRCATSRRIDLRKIYEFPLRVSPIVLRNRAWINSLDVTGQTGYLKPGAGLVSTLPTTDSP